MIRMIDIVNWKTTNELRVPELLLPRLMFPFNT